jgi:hypothetical protein
MDFETAVEIVTVLAKLMRERAATARMLGDANRANADDRDADALWVLLNEAGQVEDIKTGGGGR